VAGGHTLIDPDLAESVMRRLRETPAVAGLEKLSAQEKRILDLVAEGKTNRQIAEQMFLSEKTVKNYVSNLLAKLGFRHRTEAAVFAVKHGRA
jgi:DNA-binding NarL/FixJ family response regulator